MFVAALAQSANGGTFPPVGDTKWSVADTFRQNNAVAMVEAAVRYLFILMCEAVFGYSYRQGILILAASLLATNWRNVKIQSAPAERPEPDLTIPGAPLHGRGCSGGEGE